MRRTPVNVNFKNKIKRGVTLVDFSAPWCAPCHEQEPILARLIQRFKGKASVVEINIDYHREAARNLGIGKIPTLVIFKDGVEFQRFVGLQPEDVLLEAIERVLNRQ